MNYIYDVILNFKNDYYDFYEWNKNDNLIHVKKIPSFKLCTEDFKNIKFNSIKIDENFFKKIYGKIELFKKDNKKFKNCCIFSDGNDVIAINFDKNFINTLKSSLAIDEQDDIIDIIKYQKENKVNYKILNSNNTPIFKTRFEIENESFIKEYLKKIYDEKDYKKLSYIHLECFGIPEKDINKAMSNITKEIIKGNDNFYKIFNIFKMKNQK